MAQTLLLGSLVFGLTLAVLVLYVAGRDWQQYSPSTDLLVRRGERSSLAQASDSPVVWSLFFVGTLVVVSATVLAFVGGIGSDAVQKTAGTFLVAISLLVFAFYLFYGTFVSARSRGLKNSQAAALGSWLVGLLAIVAILLRLLEVL